MKKQIILTSLILTAMLAVAAVSARAQSATGVRAEVPFDFIVGDKTIQAGHIVVKGVTAALQGSITITNIAQGELALRTGRQVSGTDRTQEAKLVFHKYGNRYFLAQIWTPGYEAWRIMKSKEERSLERDMRLVKNFKPTRVTVAAADD